jgi:hypothetical protein
LQNVQLIGYIASFSREKTLHRVNTKLSGWRETTRRLGKVITKDSETLLIASATVVTAWFWLISRWDALGALS